MRILKLITFMFVLFMSYVNASAYVHSTISRSPSSSASCPSGTTINRSTTYSAPSSGSASCIAYCGTDLYYSSGACRAVGIKYYSPNGNDARYSCTNAPGDNSSRNYYYTSDGNGSNSCSYTYSAKCGVDYYESSNGTCSQCGIGRYSGSNNNSCSSCTNAPGDNSSRNYYYTSDGNGSNSCSYTYSAKCGVDYYESSNGTCSFVGTGYYSPASNNSRYSCTNPQGDNNSRNYYYTGSGGGSNSCPANSYSAKCGLDYYESSFGTCSWVGNGHYSPINNNNRGNCTKPSNSYFTSDGNGINNCSWSCNSGYTRSGNTCIDATPPVGSITSYSPSGWTNGSVVVTASCSDTISGCSSPSFSKTVSSNGTGYITISDNVGNTSNIGYNVTNIERIPPTAGVSYNKTNWVNEDIIVSILCNDTISGCNMVPISGWTIVGNTYSRVFTANTSGNITIRDIAGNTKSVAYAVNNIDKTRPTISANNGSNSLWRNYKVDITLSVGDTGGSGISYSKYRWDNNLCTSGTNFTNNTKIQIPSEGTHTLYLCTSDVAGNTQTWSGIYKYDITQPTVIDNYGVKNNTWQNNQQTIIFTANDPNGTDHSGISSIKWCWGATCDPMSGTTATSIVIPPDRNNILRYRTYDKATNESNIGQVTVKIEDNLPSTNINFTNISDSSPYVPGSWTNSNIQATINCSDTSGTINSGCDTGTYQYRIQSSNSACDNSGTWTGNNTFIIPAGVENKTRYVCSRVKDIANNGYSYSPLYQINIDKVIPRYQDILAKLPTDRSDLMAVDSRNFQIEVSENGGSPISLIEGYFEDYNTIDSLETIKNTSDADLNPSITNILSVNKNISNVDNDRDSDGSRQYIFRVTKVVDEAGNIFEDSINGVEEFFYNVYANTNNVNATVPVNELDDNLTADASNTELTLELKDIYGNEVIPASGINRTVGFDFDVINNLRLNQYTSNSTDAITLDRPSDVGNYTNRFLSSNVLFANETSVNGKYTYNFQVYAPTYDPNATDGRQWVNADAKILSIDYIVQQTPSTYIQPTQSGSIADGTDIEFRFKPLFKAEFTGDISKEILGNGAIQTSQLNVVKQSTIPTPNGKIYLGFGQTNGTNNIIHPNYSFTYRPNSTNVKINEGHQSTINSLQDLGIGINSKNFNVKIELENGPVDQDLATYVSSHIVYTLNGKTIVYNGNTINKPRYVDGTSLVNTRLVGLKVLGKIQSKNQQDITTNQSGTDLYAIGNNPKANLKEQIRKSVADITRNANKTPSGVVTNLSGNTWNTSQVGTKLMNGRVLYFGDVNGGNINIGNGSDLIASGVKTIVIEGGNAYIRNNISINSQANDMLGIIILEDQNGNGGNLYIDPNVTNISATIYADKSLISYNGSEEIGSSAATSELKNQLYIHGTLFTENTIGGSINPLRCPYYIEESNCDFNAAKKFDLNFTRRYFVQENGIPYDGGQSYYPDSSTHYEYPMVIEYNPNIQNTPPPLFDISEEN